MPPATWSYSNEVRLTFTFMGLSCVILGLGYLVVFLGGMGEAALADTLLGLGVFVLLFAILLIAPRLLSRGALSYSLVVEQPMDAAEDAVREALTQAGRSPAVRVHKSRSDRPPRTVTAEGLGSRFILRPAFHRETSESVPWTEVIQTGLTPTEETEARQLRERVASTLAGATPPE